MTLSEILREAADHRTSQCDLPDDTCILCDAPLPVGADTYPYCEDCAREVGADTDDYPYCEEAGTDIEEN